MGQTVTLNCSCGYSKLFHIGEGLMGRNLGLIRSIFTPQELTGFESAISGGATNYSYGQKMAYCQVCAELMSAPVLRYVENERTTTVLKHCPQCNGVLTSCDSAGICPKCGKKLCVEQTGLWD